MIKRPFQGKPTLSDGDENTQELYDEQAEWRLLLEEIKSIDPAQPPDKFRSKIKDLMNHLSDHIRQEESTMFASIDKNCSTEEKEQMSSQFKEVKTRARNVLDVIPVEGHQCLAHPAKSAN